MNSLLRRQIRKYLSPELAESNDLALFIDAVEKSYINYEDQHRRLQHAMSISSQELFEANDKLKSESRFQYKIILKLKSILENLDFNYSAKNDPEITSEDFKLMDFVEVQAQKIITINSQREKLLNSLEEQNNELNDYAHMVSHDLRSPLRNIETLASWIEEENEDMDEDSKKNIQLLKQNIEKMDGLIKGVLEYTTIGKSEEVKSEVDLKEVITSIVNLKNINQDINFTIKGDLPRLVANKSRIHQLFQNLIDNAIKYNSKTNKEIEIGYSDHKEYHQFYIKDNGNGIEKKYFEKIFESFQRLENNQDSSGIGLSIVRKIVTLCNGKIWVESELDKGSTFHFIINKK